MNVRCAFCETVNDVPEHRRLRRVVECDLCRRPLDVPEAAPESRTRLARETHSVPPGEPVGDRAAVGGTLPEPPRPRSPVFPVALPSREQRQRALYQALLFPAVRAPHEELAHDAPVDPSADAPGTPPESTERAAIGDASRSPEPPLVEPELPRERAALATDDPDLAALPTNLSHYEVPPRNAPDGTWSVQAGTVRGQFGVERKIAVKSFRPVSPDAQLRALFFEDLRIAARLRHPYAAEILDFGEQDGSLYVVTDWIEGRSLAALSNVTGAFRPIPLHIALRIASQICAALSAAHAMSDDAEIPSDLVHGDLKPERVFITTLGLVRVVDFGLGRVKARIAANADLASVDGAAPYHSPEQLRGDALDRRSDIFSLGVLLYAMVTGRHPFADDDPSKAAENILNATPPRPRDIVPSISPTLDRLICRALEKEPHRRFANAAEMQRTIDAVTIAFRLTATDDEMAVFAATGRPEWTEPSPSATDADDDDKAAALARMLDVRQRADSPEPAPDGATATAAARSDVPEPIRQQPIGAPAEPVVPMDRFTATPDDALADSSESWPPFESRLRRRGAARRVAGFVAVAAVAFAVVALLVPRMRQEPATDAAIATTSPTAAPIETSAPSATNDAPSAAPSISRPALSPPQPTSTVPAKPASPAPPVVAPNPDGARQRRKPAAPPPPPRHDPSFRPTSI